MESVEQASAAGVFTDRVAGPLSWREAGAGEPVVFLHGLGGTRSSWNPQLRDLSGRFWCIAWDMPGYGSAAPLEPLTYEAIADRLADLLDELAIVRANFVGLSFGGMHALHFVLRHPDRVDAMVLAGTSPAFGMDGTDKQDWMRSRLDPLDAGETPATMAERVIDSITAEPLTGAIRRETVASFARIPPRGLRAAVRCLPSNDVRRRLPTISQRCRVIVGELDRETPVPYARTLAEGLPNSDLYILDGVGHLTPSEAPDRFNRLVADFLLPTPPEMETR